jgi:hypothetical protein
VDGGNRSGGVLALTLGHRALATLGQLLPGNWSGKMSPRVGPNRDAAPAPLLLLFLFCISTAPGGRCAPPRTTRFSLSHLLSAPPLHPLLHQVSLLSHRLPAQLLRASGERINRDVQGCSHTMSILLGWTLLGEGSAVA